MIAAELPANTVKDCMALCGVPVDPIFDGRTPDQRVSEQIFMNSFETCMSISVDDIKDGISEFNKLTIANGKIPFEPRIKTRIIAFVQWTRSQIRIGNEPHMLAFPV